MEYLPLWVNGVDLAQHQLIVHSGKGNKDRGTRLPDRLHPACSASYAIPMAG
jgi:hypothetical protein